MRIRKLDLHGFKSFPDRTALHFGSGIGCVVGPNGCGKSNIVDAIKWCIGEQSAKSLRGDEMQDVIFAGSSDRPPVGYAEVTLTFSSDGGEPFPGEYARFSEVGVTRRLHRNGQSEYLLNGERVRRKDIVDLFLDTGIGNNLYSFIEQGRIGEIVHASPERRRLLIDEAAGITRYKARREEAQQQLEATASQLDRAADVADEMGRRLQIVEAQVARAARFKQLRARIRQDEILLALVKYADLAGDRRETRAALVLARQEADASARDVVRRDADVLARRADVEASEAVAAIRRDELAEIEAQGREAERERQVLAEQLEAANRGILGAQGDRDEQRAIAEAALAEVGLARGEADGASVEVGTLSDAVITGRSAVEGATIRRVEARQEVSRLDGLARAASDAVTVARASLGELERRAGEIPGALERARAAADGARKEVETLTDRRRKVVHAGDVRRIEAEKARGVVAGLAETSGAATTAATAAQSAWDEAERRAGAARLAAERAVREAESAWAAASERAREAVAAAEKVAVDEVRAARAAAEQVVADRLAEGRVAIAFAEDRLGEWVRALADRASAGDDDEGWRRAEADRARADAVGLRAIEDEGARAVAAARDAAIADGKTRVDAANAAVSDAEAAAGVAQAELVAARRVADDAIAARDRLRGRRDALLAQCEAEESGGAGVIAVRDALGGVPRLMDVIAIADDEAWLAAALDERLVAPIVTDAGQTIAAAAAARGAGRAAILVTDGPPTVERLLAGYQVCADLAEAVAVHRATRGGAVVRGTGERIDPDGMLHIGPIDGRGVRQMWRAQAIAALDVELAAAEASVVDGFARLASARTAAEGAAREVAASAERRRAIAADVDERRRREIADAERAARAALIAADAAVRAAQLDRQAVREAAQSELRAASSTAVADATAAGRAVIAALREVADGAVDAARREVASVEERARANAAAGTVAAVALAEQRREEAAALRLDVRRVADGDVAAANSALASARAAADAARKVRDEAEARLGSGRATQFASDVALARAEGDLLALDASSERVRVRETDLRTQIEALTRDAIALRDAIERATADLAARSAALMAAEAERDAATAVLGEREADEARARSALGTVELKAATATERARSATMQAEAARVRAGEAEIRAARADARITELRGDADALGGRVAAAQAIVDDAAQRKVGVADALGAARDRLTAARKSAREAEAGVEAANRRRDAAATTASDLDGRARELQAEIEALCARIDEKYQISVPGLLDRMDAQRRVVLGDDPAAGGLDGDVLEIGGERIEPVPALVVTPGMLEDPDLVRERVTAIEDHRARLAALGEVNLAAFEEYREIAGRYGELATQRADLESSVATIRDAITKLNRTCRERFREAFDRVNENFQAAYPRLVGGGSARLALTDDEDLLETGVDIFVQPPGKRLQNLTLLSGGEKAMAAIALLLSLFQVRPSPFCLLDEVDAPLDEANGHRFNDLLREMSGITQFIVISHNRKTMEAADVLYGVTMATPGVSRLVSVRLGA